MFAAVAVACMVAPGLLAAQNVRLPGDSVRLPKLLHPAFGEAPLGPKLGPATLQTPFALRYPPAPGLERPDLWPRFADWAAAWRRRVEARLPAPRIPRPGDGPRAGERMARGAATPTPAGEVSPSGAPAAAPGDSVARPAERPVRADGAEDRLRDRAREADDRDGDPPRRDPDDVPVRAERDANVPPPIGARPEPARPAAPDTATADSVVYLVREPRIERDTTPVAPGLPGTLGQLGDLGIHIRGRSDMKGEWNKIEPCNIFVALDCDGGLVPRLSPDIQFQLLVGGTISERVHVDVDFDQAREFDAANNLNVYYQGFDDEILRRLEVGDVNLRLPRSRFMTQGVPAGNFGFKAEGQVGPVDFQAVWAQQKGDITEREFVFGGGGTGDDVVLDQRIVWDDESYLSGQFFFLVPPDSLAGAPHIDALALQPGDAPASVRPGAAFGIQIYRAQGAGGLSPAQQADQNLFRANAVAGEGAERVEHAGLFRQLEPLEDFEIHSSGLWIVLRSRLTEAQALAISYVTETGDTIGEPDAETLSAQGLTPELRLLRGPEDIHQPGRPTWRQEMHNVYRVDSSDEVERGSVELTISLGEASAGATFVTTPDGTRAPYLRFFGLDDDNPVDELDEAQLFRPKDLFGQDAKVGGVYVIFPTLEPFARPAPVPGLGLDATQARAVLGNNANPVIYDDPDPVDRTNGSRFRLNFDYRVRSAGGTASSFNLGAIGIRSGSERIFVGNRRLVAGEDYTLDYELGTLNLLNPDAIFGANPNAQLRATWEQQPLFQIAPKSVFGVNARYQAGELGDINVLGILQSERSLVNRPQLGLEAGELFVGGVTGDLDLPSGFLDRALGAIPGLRAEGRSVIRLTGEVAMSSPNPNNQGDTFLDDFESTNEVPLSTLSSGWRWGSAPTWTPEAGSFLPVAIGTGNAARMTWQSQFGDPGTGQVSGRIRAFDIDRNINTIGADTGEPVMVMVFDDTLPASQRSWRSITTSLSTTGRDLTQSEFLEFYARRDLDADLALIFDIGTVSEDAFVFDSLGNLTGTYPDGEPWGLGILDQEAELGFDVWSDSLDQRGLWDQECQGSRQSVFALGSLSANCTRGNGLNDTEDLDGNGALLSSDGPHFRFVVPLGEASPYIVRDRTETGTEFELYRIPLRTGEGEPANGADDSTWRFVRHVRMTLTADDPTAGATVLTLARPKLLGGRWPKREGHGLVQGLTGAAVGSSASVAAVSVSPVSRVNELAYISPPNVGDRAQDVTAGVGTSAQEINEKALRLTYQDVGPGERAEVFFRYLNRPRDLLEYRRVRIWAMPRAGDFGEGGDQSLLIKFGTDGENYYLRRTPLAPSVLGDAVARSDWVDVPMDFQEWIDLRVIAEDSLIRRVEQGGPDGPIVVGSAAIVPEGATASDGRIEIWNADSTYAVVLRDRARAPNLASIRELSLAVFNAGGAASSGEVWINELRLDQPDTRSGVATDLNVAITAADFLSANVSFSSESERFQRGLDSRPDFEADRSLAVSTRMQLGKFAPTSWGLDLPVQVTHNSVENDPFFLNQSDVQARGLDGLREIGSNSTSVGVQLRKRTPTANPWVSAVVDGLSLNANWRTSESSASTSRTEASGVSAGVAYDRRPGAREFDFTPGAVEKALRWLLPGFVERSALFRNLTDAQFRWSPTALTLQTSYQDADSRTFRFDKILELPGDTLFAPTSSPATTVRSQAQLGLQPFRSMTASVGIGSQRDLLDPFLASQSNEVRAALERERGRFLGMGVGWERNRSINTSLGFNPELFEWLRPGITWNTQYGVDRNPSFVAIEEVDGDSTARLQQQFSNSRTLTRQVRFSPSTLGTVLLGFEGDDAPLWKRGTNAVLSRLIDIDLRWQEGLSSQFDRSLAEPGLGYQLGFGGIESFRVVDGATARTARDADNFRVSSGLNLPLGSTLTVGFDEGETRGLADRGGNQTTTTRTWPDLSWRWSRIPMPSFLDGTVAGANLTAGYRRTERDNRFGGTTQARLSEDRSVPLRLTVALFNGMALTYSGTLGEGTSQDPTGETQRRNRRHEVELRGSFDAPGGWETFSQPIHTSLSFGRDAQFTCRTRFAGQPTPGEDPCTATSDFVTQTLSMQLDTILRRINVGANLSYTDRQSATGLREGSRQILLTLFGQFDFQFGQMPGARGGLR